MQYNSLQDLNQSSKSWPTKALDAVFSFIVGQPNAESDISANSPEPEGLFSNSQYHAMRQEVEKLRQQNKELSKSLNSLLEENEASYFKSREREKQLKLQYEAHVEKIKLDNTPSNRRIAELEKENEELKARYQDSKKQLEACHEHLKAAETACARLKAENEALKSSCKIKDEEVAIVNELKQQNQKLLFERSTFISSIQQLAETLTREDSTETAFAARLEDAAVAKALDEAERKVRTFFKGMATRNAELSGSFKNLEVKFEKYARERELEIKALLEEKANLNQFLMQASREKASMKSLIEKLVSDREKNQESLEHEKAKNKILQTQNSMLISSLEDYKKLVFEEIQKKNAKSEEDGFEIVKSEK